VQVDGPVGSVNEFLDDVTLSRAQSMSTAYRKVAT
jgi:hypothetical protein